MSDTYMTEGARRWRAALRLEKKMNGNENEKIHIRYSALSSQILVVCKPWGSHGAWTAYIGVVEGRNHSDEMHAVLKSGTKVDAEIARYLFPEYRLAEYVS